MPTSPTSPTSRPPPWLPSPSHFFYFRFSLLIPSHDFPVPVWDAMQNAHRKPPTSPFLIRCPHLCLDTDPLIAISVLLPVCLSFFFVGFGRECPRYRRKSYSRRAKQSACVSACGGSVLVGTHSSQAVPSWYLSDHSGIRSYRRPRGHDQQPLREGGGREADIFSICEPLAVHLFPTTIT